MTTVIDDPNLDALRLLLMPHRDAQIAAGISKITGEALSPRAVNHWKSGRHFPRPEFLAALAIVIDRPLSDVQNAFARAQLSRRNRRQRMRVAARQTKKSAR